MSDRENVSAEVLAKLESAGPNGLKKTPLLGKSTGKARTEKLVELESLLARREIVRRARKNRRCSC